MTSSKKEFIGEIMKKLIMILGFFSPSALLADMDSICLAAHTHNYSLGDGSSKDSHYSLIARSCERNNILQLI